MILGLDFYDTITAWPVQLRKLASAVDNGGGFVHVVSAIKEVNRGKLQDTFRDARLPPNTVLDIVIYQNYDDIPALKAPVYKQLGCDLVIEDNAAVVAMLRDKYHMCALLVSGFSDNPLTKF